MEVKAKDKGYNLICILVLGIAGIWFIRDFHDITGIFDDTGITLLLIIIFTVILVHLTKACRLYFALYGTENTVDVWKYLKIYCKVTPVSMLLPFKLGELFRMYCYGRLLDSILNGIVVVLLDRFMDTIAVLTLIVIIWMFDGGQLSFLTYVLLIFLIFVIFLYFVSPGMCYFWKKYLLRAKASEHRLRGLRTIEAFLVLYEEIEKVVKGRGIILYLFSLLAWGIEIGSLAIVSRVSISGNSSTVISDYLASAMNGAMSVEFRKFVFISVAGLVLLYFILRFVSLTARRR